MTTLAPLPLPARPQSHSRRVIARFNHRKARTSLINNAIHSLNELSRSFSTDPIYCGNHRTIDSSFTKARQPNSITGHSVQDIHYHLLATHQL